MQQGIMKGKVQLLPGAEGQKRLHTCDGACKTCYPESGRIQNIARHRITAGFEQDADAIHVVSKGGPMQSRRPIPVLGWPLKPSEKTFLIMSLLNPSKGKSKISQGPRTSVLSGEPGSVAQQDTQGVVMHQEGAEVEQVSLLSEGARWLGVPWGNQVNPKIGVTYPDGYNSYSGMCTINPSRFQGSCNPQGSPNDRPHSRASPGGVR